MKDTITSSMICIAGIIHLLPVSGVLGPSHLVSLYGISFQEPNLIILMRHRAVLFGLMGGYLVKAAFDKPLQNGAIVSGLVAAGSFLFLAWDVKGYNSKLHRVVLADVMACGCLFIAGLTRSIS